MHFETAHNYYTIESINEKSEHRKNFAGKTLKKLASNYSLMILNWIEAKQWMNGICFCKVSGKFSLKVYKIFPSIILYLVDPCNLFRLKNNFSKTSGFLQLQISYEICSEIISWFEKKNSVSIEFQNEVKELKLKILLLLLLTSRKYVFKNSFENFIHSSSILNPISFHS